MVAIQNFLTEIGNAISLAWEFVVAMFRDFFQFLEILAKMPVYILSLFTWIPEELLAVLGITVTIVILYKVLGREG